jgi:hypothetical protein
MTSRNGHKTMKTPQKLAMFELFYDYFSGSIPPSNSFLNDFSSEMLECQFHAVNLVMPSAGHHLHAVNLVMPSAGHHLHDVNLFLPSAGHHLHDVNLFLPSAGHHLHDVNLFPPSVEHDLHDVNLFPPSVGDILCSLLLKNIINQLKIKKNGKVH